MPRNTRFAGRVTATVIDRLVTAILRSIARRALGAALLTCVALPALAAPAAFATTVDYSADGSTLMIAGDDNLNHRIQLRGVGNADEILDVIPFTSYPADCSNLSGTVPPTHISCPAAQHFDLLIDLGAGDDLVTFVSQGFDCFNAYDLDLGDGANSLYLSDDCEPGRVSVTSGSGADDLRAGSQAVTFLAGGGDDGIHGSPEDDVLHGGEGADRMFGRGGNDQVLGAGGNDGPNGGPGDDLVDGGPGDDRLEHCLGCAYGGSDKGEGADIYAGGSGTDRLYLDGHAGGVAITIDGLANDGVAGEGDNVGADIESILGTTGNDVFTGSPGPDAFEGDSGSDEIHGAGGNDRLDGDGGDDKLFGDGGDDKVQGNSGSDTVDGGPGVDALYGDTPSCVVYCSFDPDTLLARDGETDTVDCGGGADSAFVDFADVVAFCAVVDRLSAPKPPPPPAPASPFMTFGMTSATTWRVARANRVVVRCSAACRFKLAVVLPAKAAKRFRLTKPSSTIAVTSGTLKAAGKKAATMRFTRKAVRRLKRISSVGATLRLTVTDAAGRSAVRTKAINLRR